LPHRPRLRHGTRTPDRGPCGPFATAHRRHRLAPAAWANTEPIPAVTVPAELFTDFGQITLGDRLNELPQLRASFSQANSTRGIGIAGQNLLDLGGSARRERWSW
jgi:hypothetical protein